MTAFLPVFALLFGGAIAVGGVMGAVGWVHTRRVLAAGFRHGRTLNVARLPQQVEPMPQLRKAVA